jgi:hypothetical protein
MANSKTRHLFIAKDSLTFFVPFFALGAIGIAIGFLLDDAWTTDQRKFAASTEKKDRLAFHEMLDT